jgi:hypothetical protein
MRKILVSVIVLLWSVNAMAQEQLAFPFQGGKDIMTSFFQDSLIVSQDIVRHRASGVVIFKFTADEQGRISKIIIYYADDQALAEPAIDALKKSNRKWVIPNHEKFHDFIIPFSFNFNAPPAEDPELQKEVYNYIRNRKPIATTNQVPLDMATLLPTVIIKYDVVE